jgi:hypothetical protein
MKFSTWKNVGKRLVEMYKQKQLTMQLFYILRHKRSLLKTFFDKEEKQAHIIKVLRKKILLFVTTMVLAIYSKPNYFSLD